MTRNQRIGVVALVGVALYVLVNPEALGPIRGAAGLYLERVPSGEAHPEASEVSRLRHQLRVNNEELLQLKVQLDQVSRFRKSFGNEETTRLIHASVIGRSDGRTGRRLVLVNCGWDSGVRVGMPAVFGPALVGKVIAVQVSTCRVALLTDPECRIRVRRSAASDSGEGVAVMGATFGNTHGLGVRFVAIENAPKEGEQLFTAGSENGLVPPNLVVGTVKAVDTAAYRYEAGIELAPAEDLGRLQVLAILHRTAPPEEDLPADPQVRPNTDRMTLNRQSGTR